MHLFAHVSCRRPKGRRLPLAASWSSQSSRGKRRQLCRPMATGSTLSRLVGRRLSQVTIPSSPPQRLDRVCGGTAIRDRLAVGSKVMRKTADASECRGGLATTSISGGFGRCVRGNSGSCSAEKQAILHLSRSPGSAHSGFRVGPSQLLSGVTQRLCPSLVASRLSPLLLPSPFRLFAFKLPPLQPTISRYSNRSQQLSASPHP